LVGLIAAGAVALSPTSAFAQDAPDPTPSATDPGPEPQPEDFSDPIEYTRAFLRWLYLLLGGDARDLEEPAPEPEPDPG
jgi:hypothetical protein